MKEILSKPRFFALAALSVLLAVAAIWQSSNVVFSSLGTAVWFLFCSFVLGSIVTSQRGWQFLIGGFFLLCGIALFGTLTLYYHALTQEILTLFVVVTPFLLMLWYYMSASYNHPLRFRALLKEHIEGVIKRTDSWPVNLLAVTHAALLLFLFSILYYSQTTASIQSPWSVVPNYFFVLYFFTTAALVLYCLFTSRTKAPLILIILHSFLTVSVALIVYQIGYGYDPFIHEATQNIIAREGGISPTPPYYLGFYGIVVALHFLTSLSIASLNAAIVPVVFAVFVPLSIYFVFSQWLQKRFALVLSLSPLLLPLDWFIMSTPQNLANVFFMVTIILSLLYYRGLLKGGWLYFLALAVTVIHPLAGIPLCITVVLLTLYKVFYSTYHRLLPVYGLVGLLFVYVMPLVFIVGGLASGFTLSASQFNFPHLSLDTTYSFFVTMAHFIDTHAVLMGLAIVLFGAYHLSSMSLLKNNAGYLVAATVIWISYFISKYFLQFDILDSSDSAAFVERLLVFAFYTTLPIALLGLHIFFKQFFTLNKAGIVFATLLFTGVATASLYTAYPRVDFATETKFYSISQSDINTVRFINNKASDKYVVLANQMVGAAAIKTYGFATYYGDEFYYSLPNATSRILYPFFLQMVQQGPTKETALNAMQTLNVDHLFFVLNSYWSNSNAIKLEAMEEADSFFSIDEGAVYVFEYKK